MAVVIYKRRVVSCSGGVKYAVTFPAGISRSIMDAFVKNGFQETAHLSKIGLMNMKKENIVVTGAICNREGLIFCSASIKEKDCEKLIEKAIADLSVIFTSVQSP